MRWYEKRPERYEAEQMLIKKYYPKARIFERKGRIIVFLKIRGRKTNYLIETIYPKDFPYEQPKAFVTKPQIEDALHRWGDGSLSLHGVIKEPPRLSGKIILDWSKKWVFAYENWVDTGVWPERM
jgi:hypothetical protein